jgi:hypothetical protein
MHLQQIPFLEQGSYVQLHLSRFFSWLHSILGSFMRDTVGSSIFLHFQHYVHKKFFSIKLLRPMSNPSSPWAMDAEFFRRLTLGRIWKGVGNSLNFRGIPNHLQRNTACSSLFFVRTPIACDNQTGSKIRQGRPNAWNRKLNRKDSCKKIQSFREFSWQMLAF